MGVALAALFSALATVAIAQTNQFQRATCAGADPTAAIAACDDMIEFGNLDPKSKVMAYVNRGKAHDTLKEPERAQHSVACEHRPTTPEAVLSAPLEVTLLFLCRSDLYFNDSFG